MIYAAIGFALGVATSAVVAWLAFDGVLEKAFMRYGDMLVEDILKSFYVVPKNPPDAKDSP